jgi:GNAT superfamily N-acetyltransferase
MVNDAIAIRQMQASDVPSVADLCGQLGYPATPAQIARRWSALAHDGGHAVLVAVRDDRVVAWLHVATRPILEFDLSAEIWGLVVDERERGAGIGRALVAAAEQWAADAGCVGMRVRTRIERARAHAVYEREGYSRVKKQHVFENAIVSRNGR